MLRSSTGTTSQYEQIKLTYLTRSSEPSQYEFGFKKPLHQRLLETSEFLHADKASPASPEEKADLENKKAIVDAINHNDLIALKKRLDRSVVETKKAGVITEMRIITANLYSLISLANQPHCTKQTREMIYHCLAEKDWATYFARVFTTPSRIIFKVTDQDGYPYFLFNRMHLAATLNLKEKCEELLLQYGDREKDAFSYGLFSSTTLGLAATFGNLDIVIFLHSKGAKLITKSSMMEPHHRNIPTIYITLSEKHDAVTRYLLDNITLEDPIDFLLAAAGLHNLPILKYAFEKFQIPFSTLIKNNAYPIIFALIEAGVELPADAPDDLKTAAQLWKIDMASASTPTAATAAAAAACITTAKPDIDSISTLTSATARP